MDAFEERLRAAEEEIKAVLVRLAAVECKLDEPGTDITYLRKEKDQLRDKEKQLLEENRLLPELILRQSSGK